MPCEQDSMIAFKPDFDMDPGVREVCDMIFGPGMPLTVKKVETEKRFILHPWMPKVSDNLIQIPRKILRENLVEMDGELFLMEPHDIVPSRDGW